MRKWSKQAFLNPADSNDDGWFKFSMRPLGQHRSRTIGFNVQYIISDCSNKIYLEFEPDMVSVNADGSAYNVAEAKDSIKDAEARIKKMIEWEKAVVTASAKIIEALEEHKEKVQTAIDIANTRE